MRPLDPRLLRQGGAVRALVLTAGGRSVLDVAVLVAEALVLASVFADVVDGTASTAGLVRAGIVLVLLALARGLVAWVSRTVFTDAASRTAARLRHRLLARVLEDGRLLPPGEVAVLATRGVDAVQPYVAGYVPQLVGAAIVPFGLLAVVLVIDRPSGVILAVALPLVPLFLSLVGRFSGARAAESWAGLERLSGHLHDVVVGLPTLKRFGRHRAQRETILRMSEQSRRSTMAALRVAFLSAFVLELATTLSVALVAVPLGIRLVHGSVGLAAAFAVLLLAPEVFAPIRRVGAEYHTATEGAAATDRILGLVETGRPPVGDQPVPATLGVTASGVVVRHPGRLASAPRQADLAVGPGEVVALVGPNGSGKSTLLDVLRGARRPDEGTVAVDGVPLDRVEPTAWSDAIAWVPQRPALVDDTVRANIVLGAPSAEAAVAAVARSVGLGDLLDRRARSLSAGERQRVALARALLRVERGGGRLALLDEPTANLDAATEATVVDVVRRLAARGAAVVVVAHRPALIAAADRVVAVVGGDERLAPSDELGAGTPSAVVAREPRTDGTEGFRASVADPAERGSSLDGTPRSRSAWRWLRDEGRPVRGRLLATVALGAGATASGLALTACAAWLLSRASERPEILSLGVMVAMVRGFALAKAGLRYVERLASHDTILRLVGGLRARVFDRLAVLTPGGLPGLRHGDVLARLVGDLDAVQELWLRAVLPPVVAFTAGVGLVLTGVLTLPAAALAFALGLALGGIVLPWLGTRWERGARTAAATERAELTGDVVDLVEAAPELHAYGGAEPVLTRVADRDLRLASLHGHEARMGGLVDGLETLVRAAVAAAVLVAAGIAAGEGGLAVLLVPALVLLGWSLPEIVGAMPGTARHLADFVPAAGRVTGVLDADDPVPDPDHPLAPPIGPLAVSIDGIVLRWPDQASPVLRGADLDVAAGELVFVVGPSGAGKSTLAAGLVRFLAPEQGAIRLGGVDVRSLRGDDVRRLVGWCAQDTHLFDATIRDNLRVARPNGDDHELLAAMRAVGLESWVSGLPCGLDTRVGTGGARLSGGQAQRLALAQVLLADPPVVVLDEPTANLDPETAEELMVDLVEGTRGRTTIVITHRSEGVGPDARVVRLENGRFTEIGSRAGATVRQPAVR